MNRYMWVGILNPRVESSLPLSVGDSGPLCEYHTGRSLPRAASDPRSHIYSSVIPNLVIDLEPLHTS